MGQRQLELDLRFNEEERYKHIKVSQLQTLVYYYLLSK